MLLFLVFLGLTLAAGMALAFTRNLVYAAFLLFAVLFGVAALFVFVGAEFLAISQVLVYVGGILILLVFGVMLTDKNILQQPKTGFTNLVPGIGIAGALGFALCWLALHATFPEPSGLSSPHAARPNAEQIGIATLTDYVIPFELLSVLLLVALVGAAHIARAQEK